MKIRTITSGISFRSLRETDKIKPVAEFNQKAKKHFKQEGYEVQTTRITTNSWEEYIQAASPEKIVSEIQEIEQICRSLGADFFNIGYANTPEKIDTSSEIIKNSSVISCSSKMGDFQTGINHRNVGASARAIKGISEQTESGLGNFRFCAWCNCKPGIPFFPAGYHKGETSFAIGLECSDLVMKAFSKSNGLFEAEMNLKATFEEELKPMEKMAQQLSKESKIKYGGIDASVAPSLDKSESIAFAYEKLGIGKFGQPGTLAISALITGVLKSLSVKTCGYSGLMLPVCEDFGLAKRAGEKAFSLMDLLLYSAVCGCGLDAIPLPGDITIEKIEAILLDVATLATKLNKPLSARLLPFPGRKAGEMTTFNSPYLVNCRILDVK
jgi:uncharacterized protein (UPF0210 family)